MDTTDKQALWNEVQRDHKAWIEHDPVGLPDEADYKNICVMIRNFKKKNPGELEMIAAAAHEKRKAAFNDFSSTDRGEMNMRHVFTMPVELLKKIELSYPLMFTNKKHMAWFRKNFPIFSASRKY